VARLDVELEGAAAPSSQVGHGYIRGEGQNLREMRRSVDGLRTGWWVPVVGPDVVEDPLGDYLFQKLAEALQEGHRSIALLEGVTSSQNRLGRATQ
jgi:hypothetical protein